MAIVRQSMTWRRGKGEPLTREEIENAAASLFDVMAKGAVKAVIGQRYALVDAPQAQIDVMARKTTGSTVIIP